MVHQRGVIKGKMEKGNRCRTEEEGFLGLSELALELYNP
jgi:hypothetical protein